MSDVIYQKVRQITCASCQQVINVAAQKPFTQIECPHCKSKLHVPALLGPFLLLEVLGMGGMGAVYRAMDQSLGRFVAIKVMKKQLGDDQKLVDSFLREARAAAALNHANIVQIYSCGEQSGQPYIAMELVSGGRLDLMMEGGKQLAEDRLLQISIDVAQGLSAANEVNLVHGDIKPANILFDKHNVAKIVDFGLAQFVNRSQERGEVWGTPYYISPERARGGKADHRSDIYSLGATMFHALTAKPPFDGPTASDVVVARLRQPAPDVRSLRPDLHEQTAQLISRMMAADPMVRYPTSASLMADMREALAAARAGPAKPGKNASSAAKNASPGGQTSGGKGTMVASIIGAVVVVGAAAYFFKGGGKDKSSSPPIAPQPGVEKGTSAPPVAVPAPPPVSGAEPFFKGEEETALIKAIQDGMAKPDELAAKLSAFAAARSIPGNSGRMLWVKLLQGLGGRASGQEMKAVEAWSAVADVRVSSDTSPNNMPRFVARMLMAQTTVDHFNSYSKLQPAWYGSLADLFRATDLLRLGRYVEARPLLERYLSASGSNPAWPYAMQPAVRQWLGQIDGFRNAARPARAANNQNEVNNAYNEFKRVAPALLHKLDANAMLADVTVSATTTASPPGAVNDDKKNIENALKSEKAGSMSRRDYAAAADNLVALNQKLGTREGREMLANVVNQIDRMDAVKNLIVKGTQTSPQQAGELGGKVEGGDASGLKVGGSIKPWSQVSNGIMVQLAAACISASKDNDKKKADDLISLAVFCSMNGDTFGAKNFAGQARSKDGGASATLQKLLPGI